MDASFADNGRVNPTDFGRVRTWQDAPQDRLCILVDGIAGTDVGRGDPAVSLRSSAHIKGPTGCSAGKLARSHDSGRIQHKIGLWVWH